MALSPNGLSRSAKLSRPDKPFFGSGQNKLKDALFEMPEDIIRGGLALGQKIETCLDRNRDICATASVYEIAPEADP